MKFLKRFFLAVVIVVLVGVSVFFFWMPRYSVVPILMYHHVDRAEHVDDVVEHVVQIERAVDGLAQLVDQRELGHLPLAALEEAGAGQRLGDLSGHSDQQVQVALPVVDSR